MPTITTSPWQSAVDRMSSKTVIGSKLRSADWSAMPLALRERAMFSAGVENVRVLSAMKDKLTAAAQQLRTDGTLMNQGRFVADMRNLLGAAPGDSGDLTDITSVRRLSLIWDFQQQDAHGFASRKADMDPDVLDAFPAYRLIRIEERRVPRNWYVRWGAAGASVGWFGAAKGTMVALKTSPIWSALSRFGRPWPPFDYSSGMGLDDADRDEAESLNLLPKEQPPAERLQDLRDSAAAQQQQWNEGLQASVKGLGDQAKAWLKDSFGDQISIEGDSVKWREGAAPKSTEPAPVEPVPAPTPKAEPTVLPDVERVATAVSKAASKEEAHAIVSLPPVERGSLSLRPTQGAAAQAAGAHDFLRSVLHKDVAPSSSIKVELYGGRSNYDIATATAKVRSGDVQVTIHEIAHHIEVTNPRIYNECVAFRDSRTKPGEKPQRLSTITGHRGYKPSEIAIEDEWEERGGTVYSGKVYRGINATEILTTGLERLYADPVGFARADPEYFKFILRVLRPTP